MQRLQRAEVAAEDLGLDTCSDPARFFSYRRTTLAGEPDYGRQFSAIVLPRSQIPSRSTSGMPHLFLFVDIFTLGLMVCFVAGYIPASPCLCRLPPWGLASITEK